MRGSLVIIAALCVVAAAEASSVRFISVDEGKNGTEKADRSQVSEGTDPVTKKKVEDVVKKINDGEETVKTLDADRSSASDKEPESAGGGVKKAASTEKSNVHKRDVRRALERLAKRRTNRQMTDDDLKPDEFIEWRSILIKTMSLQQTMANKILAGLMYAIDEMEEDSEEKDAMINLVRGLQEKVVLAYNDAIRTVKNNFKRSDMPSRAQRKSTRAQDIPDPMTAMNQRNPFALVPLLIRLISGAATIADIATNIAPTRSDEPDLTSLLQMTQQLVSSAGFPQIIDYM